MKTAIRQLRAWAFPLSILAAVLLAHAGCLDSIFYLDDWSKIHENPAVAGGKWEPDWKVQLTNLSYHLTWRAVGFSTFWFHLYNLMLHLAGALSIYTFGRYLLWKSPSAGHDFSHRNRVVAWVAALLFATHPLTTEVTNYVRARDHGMVGFFTFLAVCFTVMGLRCGWKWFILAAAAVCLAAYSKGPGLPHAVLGVGIALLAYSERGVWRRIFSSRRAVVAGIISAAIFAGLFGKKLMGLLWIFQEQVAASGADFGWHGLTQCRVFWNYVKLMIWPQGLSSDHLVAWTRSTADVEAWVAAAGIVLLSAGILYLWLRRCQPWAGLATLAVTVLGLRWLYVVSELMVEYRTYPAMPYLALLAAGGLWKCWENFPKPTVLFTAVLVSCYAFISLKRSDAWSSEARISQAVLQQDPWQLRAINGLSYQDVREKRWQPILDRNPDFSTRLNAVMAENRRDPCRSFENWPLWVVCEECMVSEALLHTQGTAAAKKYHRALFARMQENHLDEHNLLRAIWEGVAGKISMEEGSKNTARLHLLEAEKRGIPSTEISKLLEQLDAQK